MSSTGRKILIGFLIFSSISTLFFIIAAIIIVSLIQKAKKSGLVTVEGFRKNSNNGYLDSYL